MSCLLAGHVLNSILWVASIIQIGKRNVFAFACTSSVSSSGAIFTNVDIRISIRVKLTGKEGKFSVAVLSVIGTRFDITVEKCLYERFAFEVSVAGKF